MEKREATKFKALSLLREDEEQISPLYTGSSVPAIALSTRARFNVSRPGNAQNASSAALRVAVILDVLAGELMPADLTNLLVAIRHIPREGWRRKYLNLFRQLPHYGDWIARMKAKGYAIFLVGMDVKRLGLYVSNSFKYPIDRSYPLIIWLAVVPVIQRWQNHEHAMNKSGAGPHAIWQLHPSGDTHEKSALNQDRVKELSVWTQGRLSVAHRNMFATPLIDDRQRHNFLTSTPPERLGPVFSGWWMNNQLLRHDILTVFYSGLHVGSDGQETLAYLYNGPVLPWNSCHPPLIPGSERTSRLCHYDFLEMRMQSSPRLKSQVRFAWDRFVPIVVHVRDQLWNGTSTFLIKIPIDRYMP
jgi:hypothetical protein